MKFLLVIAAYVVFYKVEAFKRDSGNHSLQKAFLGIVKALSKQANFLSIVVEGVSSDNTNFAFFASTAGIPHVLTRIESLSESLYWAPLPLCHWNRSHP